MDLNLTPWKKGDPFSAKHLNEGVSILRSLRSIVGMNGVSFIHSPDGSTVSLDDRLLIVDWRIGVISAPPTGSNAWFDDRYWVKFSYVDAQTTHDHWVMHDDPPPIDGQGQSIDENPVVATNLSENLKGTHTLAIGTVVQIFQVRDKQDPSIFHWFFTGGSGVELYRITDYDVSHGSGLAWYKMYQQIPNGTPIPDGTDLDLTNYFTDGAQVWGINIDENYHNKIGRLNTDGTQFVIGFPLDVSSRDGKPIVYFERVVRPSVGRYNCTTPPFDIGTDDYDDVHHLSFLDDDFTLGLRYPSEPQKRVTVDWRGLTVIKYGNTNLCHVKALSFDGGHYGGSYDDDPSYQKLAVDFAVSPDTREDAQCPTPPCTINKSTAQIDAKVYVQNLGLASCTDDYGSVYHLPTSSNYLIFGPGFDVALNSIHLKLKTIADCTDDDSVSYIKIEEKPFDDPYCPCAIVLSVCNESKSICYKTIQVPYQAHCPTDDSGIITFDTHDVQVLCDCADPAKEGTLFDWVALKAC